MLNPKRHRTEVSAPHTLTAAGVAEETFLAARLAVGEFKSQRLRQELSGNAGGGARSEAAEERVASER